MKRPSHVFVCLLTLGGCEGMPEEIGSDVDDPAPEATAPEADPDDVGSIEQAHRNHWSYGSTGGTRVGLGTYTSACGDTQLEDLDLGLEPGRFGFRTYYTFDSRVVSRYGVKYRTYYGIHRGSPDFYEENGVMLEERVSQLMATLPYWRLNDIWGNVAGQLGDRFFNTAAMSHYLNKCKNAFVVKMIPDRDYTRGEYSFTVDLYAAIKDKAACESTNLAGEPWSAIDVYVRECKPDGTCETKIPKKGSGWDYNAYRLQVPGSWNSTAKKCDVSAWVHYKPRRGWAPRSINIVASAGVGHVPAAAKISIHRPYQQ